MKSTNLYSTFSCIIVIEEKNRLSKASAVRKDWMNAERSARTEATLTGRSTSLKGMTSSATF